jgi:hypothetical protein
MSESRCQVLRTFGFAGLGIFRAKSNPNSHRVRTRVPLDLFLSEQLAAERESFFLRFEPESFVEQPP